MAKPSTPSTKTDNAKVGSGGETHQSGGERLTTNFGVNGIFLLQSLLTGSPTTKTIKEELPKTGLWANFRVARYSGAKRHARFSSKVNIPPD